MLLLLLFTKKWAEKKTHVTIENFRLANIILKRKFILLSNDNMIKDVKKDEIIYYQYLNCFISFRNALPLSPGRIYAVPGFLLAERYFLPNRSQEKIAKYF